MKSFWTNRVATATAFEIKKRHADDRSGDKGRRWEVRKDVHKNGLTSNLFPLEVPVTTRVYRYELDVSRKVQSSSTGQKQSAPVAPARAWRMFAQALRKHKTLPPMIRVQDRIYSTTPIPKEVLELPREFYDLGWERCRLQLADQVELCKLQPLEMRMVINKILPWALNFHARHDGNFAVVRDTDGKMVCTDDGISVSGLRIFRGTTAQVLFIGDTEGSSSAAQMRSTGGATNVPQTEALKSLTPGVIDTPIRVKCVEEVRFFTFKGHDVIVYLVCDKSGTMAMTLWGFPEKTLTPGQVYEFTKIKAKQSSHHQRRGDFLIELEATCGQAVFKEVTLEGEEKPKQSQHAATPANDNLTSVAGRLGLRIDTKCTVASEKSLWEEIKQYFGQPPYDEDKQRRISRAVAGTPCVVSVTLRHSSVRLVRFNFTSSDDVPIDHQLRHLAHDFEKGQPYAVLQDYSLVPLQVLHCCFDPRMRSWQEVTVPACSFMPERRMGVLEKFRGALAEGLTQWGVNLGGDAWNTKQLAVMPDIARGKGRVNAAPAGATALLPGYAAPPQPPTRPQKILFVAVSGSRTTPEERQANIKTVQALAKILRSSDVSDSSSEPDALRFIDQVLMPQGALMEPNAAVVIVAADRQTRAMRWLVAECLKRGVLPVLMPGTASEKKHRILAENCRLNMTQKFGTNPVQGVDIGHEVPKLKNKRVLVVGVDTCHQQDVTTGAVVGVLNGPATAHMIPTFWRNDVRGQELEQVTNHFGNVVDRAISLYGGLDEVVVFQDGNVFSELESMRARVPAESGLTFMCLHKRTNIRFVHKGQVAANPYKGTVVQSLTPAPANFTPAAPSFYLQNHDCNMSTARPVQYTVHCVSPTLELADVQRLSYALSHIAAPAATKLPMPTRCAHKLSAVAERLMDACPDFRAELIPDPLCQRVWFL